MYEYKTRQQIERIILSEYLAQVQSGDEVGAMRARKIAAELSGPMHELLLSARRALARRQR